MHSKIIERILLLLILLTAVVLRFWNLGVDSITHDELSALYRLQHNSLWQAIKAVGIDGDGHPIGVQAFLYCWTNGVGDSPFALRLPFACAGVLSVYFIYLIGKLFNPTIGLLAASCLAVLEFPVIYSQLARPYSFGLLFTVAAAYFLFRYSIQVKAGNKNKLSLISFVIMVVFCCYTHYFAFMQAGLLCIAGGWLLPREELKGYIVSLLAIPILFIPHVGLFIKQFSQQGLDWLGAPTASFLFEFLWYAFNYTSWFIGLIVLIVFISIWLNRKSITHKKEQIILILLFIVPFLVGFTYSILVKPVLQFSLLLFSFPFLLLFLFSFSGNIKNRWVFIITSLTLIAGTLSTVVGNQFLKKHHFAVYKQLVEKTYEWNKKYGEKNITRILNVGNPFFVDYYFKQKEGNNIPKVEAYNISAKSQLKETQFIIKNSNSEYFMYAWSNGYYPKENLQLIQEEYPNLVHKEWYFNSEIYLFSKTETHEAQIEKLYSSKCLDMNDCENWTNTSSDSIFYFSKDVEYGPTFLMNLNSWVPNEFDILTLQVTVNLPENFTDATLVLSFDNNGNNLSWKSTGFSDYKVQPGTNIFYVAHRLPPEVWKNINNATVKAYLWNNQKQQFAVNSLEFKIERGNPIVYDKYYVPK